MLQRLFTAFLGYLKSWLHSSNQPSPQPGQPHSPRRKPKNSVGDYLRSHAVILELPSGRGTGFLIDNAYILTAHHNLEAGEDVIIRQYNVSLGGAYTIAVDKQHDLALLCLKNTLTGKRRARLTQTLPSHGDIAFFYSGIREKVIQTHFRRNKRSGPWQGYDNAQSGDSGTIIVTRKGHIASVHRGRLTVTTTNIFTRKVANIMEASYGANMPTIRSFLREYWPTYEDEESWDTSQAA